MHQKLWGYKVEEKLYAGVREQKRLNTTEIADRHFIGTHKRMRMRTLQPPTQTKQHIPLSNRN
jgi:hypothetical protein